MAMRSFAWALSAGLVLLVASACDDSEDPRPSPSGTTTSTGGSAGTGGSGAEGAGGEGGAPGPCAVLTPMDTMIELYSSAIFALSARVGVEIEGYAKTRLNLELYPSGNDFPQPGTFDLSIAPDDSYATCEHCVLLVAYDKSGQPRRAFFQDSGTMTVTKFDAESWGVAAGEASDVRLVEVTQNLDGSWNVVPGGQCFDLPTWSFDTTVVDGGPCERAEDCPNEAVQICDVESKTCQPGECSLFGDPPYCDEGYRCMSQYGAFIDREEAGPAIGACYPTCQPGAPGSAGDCATGSMCFPLDATQTTGVCLMTGGPALGEACTLPDVVSGCAAGAVCTGEPPTCQAVCNYLTETSDCPSGAYCSAMNVCEPLDVGDVAPVGALCAPGTATLTDCGPEGDAFRGLCFRLFETEEDSTCARTCRTADPDCPAGLSCIGVFTNPHVGICADPGACGDGKLDLLGAEVCDDGNTESGDGCASDCASAELGPLCAVATPLVPGAVVVDTNEGGVTGYTSLCDPFIANPSRTFSFLPPAPGELTLKLTSLRELGVSVLADCQDSGSELGCRMNDGDDVLHVNFATVPAQPVLIVVRGQTPLETGLFILQSSFVAATCGDGLMSGPEACDDQNQLGGDGCAADCSAIEWPELCAGLPPIEHGDLVDGTLDGAFRFFDLTQMCSYESGNDRAFTFVAPSAGELTVDLTSEDDLVLFVRDGCGPIDQETYLACGNWAQAGETESSTVSLTAGQVVTVVVDGFTREDAGPFTLTATFSP